MVSTATPITMTAYAFLQHPRLVVDEAGEKESMDHCLSQAYQQCVVSSSSLTPAGDSTRLAVVGGWIGA
jgi:hypothetical protein